MLLAFSSRANLPSIDTFSFLNVGLKEGSLFLESARGDDSHLKRALGLLVALWRVFVRQPREHPYSKLSFVWHAENSLIKDRY